MEIYKHKKINNEIWLDFANRYANEFISWFESKIEYYSHHVRRKSIFFCIILTIQLFIRYRKITHSLNKAVKNLKFIDSDISKCLTAYRQIILDYLDSIKDHLDSL